MDASHPLLDLLGGIEVRGGRVERLCFLPDRRSREPPLVALLGDSLQVALRDHLGVARQQLPPEVGDDVLAAARALESVDPVEERSGPADPVVGAELA